MYTTATSLLKSYIRNVVPDDAAAGDPGLSGRPDADFHGVVNFAFTEFSEVDTAPAQHPCACL